jgi:uncharacterized membrane protein
MSMAKNVNDEYRRKETLGDRVSDKIASFGGSWSFIGIFFLVLGIYVLLNMGIFGFEAFDCYPFVFLNLILACIAAIQAPIIMMSQNRELKRDRLRAEQDYDVNVRAEQEIQDVQQHLHRMEERISWLVDELQRMRGDEKGGV